MEKKQRLVKINVGKKSSGKSHLLAINYECDVVKCGIIKCVFGNNEKNTVRRLIEVTDLVHMFSCTNLHR